MVSAVLPWWGWLLVAVGIVAIGALIPWKKISRMRSGRSYIKGKKSIQELREQEKLNPEGKPISVFEQITQRNRSIDQKHTGFAGLIDTFNSKYEWMNKPLVYVKPEADSCDLCRPFENKVLCLNAEDNQYTTMTQAMTQGYHHLGCKHQDITYYPQETTLVPAPWSQEDQKRNYKNRKRQYRYENQLRQLRFQLDNCTEADEIDKLQQAQKALEEEFDNFLKTHELEHNLIREQDGVNNIDKWT